MGASIGEAERHY